MLFLYWHVWRLFKQLWTAPSPLQGEGWDGGSALKISSLYLERTTPTLTLPLAGGGDRSLLMLSTSNNAEFEKNQKPSTWKLNFQRPLKGWL